MLLAVALAHAGYGDVVDDFPSASERLLHLWTNAARVAPDAFGDDYTEGGCSFDRDFSSDEQTAKEPLYLDTALNEVARVHSIDMAENGCFQHESGDGTDTWDRIGQYYAEGGALGENIAEGGVTERYAVLSMWMCSDSGHRANIMSGEFNELGTGVADAGSATYFTQDFAGGIVPSPARAVRMGANDGATFYADWADTDAPARLELVLDGDALSMSLQWGADEQGIYQAKATLGDCSSYYFDYETAAGETGTFPEEGAFLTGAACTEAWAERGADDEDDEDDEDDDKSGDLSVVGCDATGLGGAGGLGVLVAAGLLRRRR